MEKRKVLRKKRRLNLGIRKSIATFLTIAMLSAASMSAVAFAVGQDDVVDVDAIYVEDVYEAAPVEVAPEVVEEPAADEPAANDYAAADVAPVEATDVAEVDVYEIEIEPATFGDLTGAEVQALIDAANPGEVISFDPGAVITGSFTINQGITLEGNGATIILDSAGQFIGIQGDNITLTGFAINYTYAGVSQANIIVWAPSNNVTISNNEFSIASGPGSIDASAITTQENGTNGITGLVISGNTFAPYGSSSWRSLAINFGANGTIVDGNTFSGTFDRPLWINSNNVQVTNNNFTASYAVSAPGNINDGNSIRIWADPSQHAGEDLVTVITGNTFADGQFIWTNQDRPTNIDFEYLLLNNTYVGLTFPFDIIRDDAGFTAPFNYVTISDLEVIATAGGSVSSPTFGIPMADFYVLEVGQETSVTATPDTGYIFVGWTIEGDEDAVAAVIAELGGAAALEDATITFTKPAGSVILTANFEGIPCEVCDTYPCECPVVCEVCDTYPCACCPVTGEYPCVCPVLCEVCGEEYPCECEDLDSTPTTPTVPGNGGDDDDDDGDNDGDDADGAGNNRRPGTGPKTGDVVNMFGQIAALAALITALAGAGLLHARKQN